MEVILYAGESIRVEQDNKQKDDWFRGDYYLVLRPNIAELVPSEDVEH